MDYFVSFWLPIGLSKDLDSRGLASASDSLSHGATLLREENSDRWKDEVRVLGEMFGGELLHCGGSPLANSWEFRFPDWESRRTFLEELRSRGWGPMYIRFADGREGFTRGDD